jgi:hypothetical protein
MVSGISLSIGTRCLPSLQMLIIGTFLEALSQETYWFFLHHLFFKKSWKLLLLGETTPLLHSLSASVSSIQSLIFLGIVFSCKILEIVILLNDTF